MSLSANDIETIRIHLNAIKERLCNQGRWTEAEQYQHIVNELRDVVDIVHCKECKHWDGYYCHHHGYGNGHGNYAPPVKNKMGFCDWADEKKG